MSTANTPTVVLLLRPLLSFSNVQHEFRVACIETFLQRMQHLLTQARSLGILSPSRLLRSDKQSVFAH